MGTIINGNKWSGACINGNVVSGLVKNGAVFYKKNQQELYKRRIMVGDNLKGKTVYPEFTTPSEDIFVEGRKGHIIIFNNNNDESIYLINHIVDSEGFCDDIIVSISNAEYIYRENESNILKQNNVTIFNDKDYFVTNIYDYFFSYRCLYIEDPNIRPLQVGDKVVSGTKFYGVVPDNAPPVDGSIIFYDDTDNSVGYFFISNEDNAELWLGKMSPQYIYKKTPPEYGGLTENNSIIISETEYTIARIKGDNLLLNYVLVDTTTLGN